MRRSVLLIALAGGVQAFSPTTVPSLRVPRPSACAVRMGKEAADGIFTPAVKAAKVVLGDKKLNAIRGDVIAMHSKVFPWEHACVSATVPLVGCAPVAECPALMRCDLATGHLGVLRHQRIGRRKDRPAAGACSFPVKVTAHVPDGAHILARVGANRVHALMERHIPSFADSSTSWQTRTATECLTKGNSRTRCRRWVSVIWATQQLMGSSRERMRMATRKLTLRNSWRRRPRPSAPT